MVKPLELLNDLEEYIDMLTDQKALHPFNQTRIKAYINGLRDRLEPQVSKGDVQPVQTAGLSPKALEIVGKYGLDCPDCNNEGFYWQGQDDPEMIQCQFCYVEAKSKYNLKQDLIEMIGGLSC